MPKIKFRTSFLRSCFPENGPWERLHKMGAFPKTFPMILLLTHDP